MKNSLSKHSKEKEDPRTVGIGSKKNRAPKSRKAESNTQLKLGKVGDKEGRGEKSSPPNKICQLPRPGEI